MELITIIRDIIIALTVPLTVAFTVGFYLYRLISKRSKGAKERCKIVYDGFLIKEVNKVIREVEEGDPPRFYLSKDKSELEPLLLKSTKDCLDKLEKAFKDYYDMYNIAASRVREKLKQRLKECYAYISNEKQEKILSHLGDSGDVVTRLLDHFHNPFNYSDNLEIHLIKAKIRSEDVSFDWFKELPYFGSGDWKEKLNDLLRDAGASLESFLESINSRLNDKDEPSIRFLKEYREICLKAARNAKDKLEKDARKLKSKFGFVYGIGDEMILRRRTRY